MLNLSHPTLCCGDAGSLTSTKDPWFLKLWLSYLHRKTVHQNRSGSSCPRNWIWIAISAEKVQPEIAAALQGPALCCLAKLCGKIENACMILSNTSGVMAFRYWFYLLPEPFQFYISVKESVRGIFLTFIWLKLNKTHKNSQGKKKKEKSIWDIYSQLFFWFFLSSTHLQVLCELQRYPFYSPAGFANGYWWLGRITDLFLSPAW